MKIKLILALIFSLALLTSASPVYAAIPTLPHAFYGDVEINGVSAPDGSRVSATVSEGTIAAVQNPVATVDGSYGEGGLKLLVQGDSLSGAITFYVKGHEAVASPAVTFEAGGGPTRVDLSVTIAAPPPEDGDGEWEAAAPAYVETNLFGAVADFRISDEGKILKTIEATSEDGMLTVTIPKGTIALDKKGNPLYSLEVTIDESPPDPPEDAHIIGLAYEFGPDGATFDPPITFTWSYDPDDLPEGVAEEDLVLAYYDEDKDEWVELDCVVDTKNNTITASVEHFTTFAIIGIITPLPPPPPAPAAFSVSSLSVKPLEVQPDETVTITVSVANTGGTEGSYTVVLMMNGVKEAEKSVTIAAGSSQDVSFSVTKEDAGSYSVVVDGLSASFVVVVPVPPPPPPPVVPPEVRPPVNWPLLGGIIAAVVIVGLLIFFLVRKKAY